LWKVKFGTEVIGPLFEQLAVGDRKIIMRYRIALGLQAFGSFQPGSRGCEILNFNIMQNLQVCEDSTLKMSEFLTITGQIFLPRSFYASGHRKRMPLIHPFAVLEPHTHHNGDLECH